VLGFGFACTFPWDLFGGGAIAAGTFLHDLGYLDSGYWGGHLNNIHFCHEKRVAENLSLTGFLYEPTYSWLGVGSTNVLGGSPPVPYDNPALNTSYPGIAAGADLKAQTLLLVYQAWDLR
jgi:hypothetical protein